MIRELAEKMEKENFSNWENRYLSMGMTDDFEIAIEEGSNMVRIGRAYIRTEKEEIKCPRE
jgi:PLP dependent protein